MPTRGRTTTATSSTTADTPFLDVRTTASIAHCRRSPRSGAIRRYLRRGIQTCCPMAGSTPEVASAAVCSAHTTGWAIRSRRCRRGFPWQTDLLSCISASPTWDRVVQRWWSTSGTREISEPVSRCMTLTVGRSSKALMRQLWFIRTVHQGRFGGIRKCGPCPISHRRR